ncbi:cell division protein FtsQ/DivIB [Ectothiorhodospiraceae bacterium 2226]|nr:cell division protein FtsQ/DivIB [Ectothiorhodospiraceae bacterium 2226]
MVERTARLRRSLLIAWLALGTAVAAAGAYWLQQSSVLPIERVRVEGALAHVTEVELREVVGRHSGGFFRVDVDQVQRDLLALPWVREAAVRRVWPDTLAVHVVEREALARWAAGGLVSREGRLFEPAEETWPEGLPLFEGPTGYHRMLAAQFDGLSAALAPLDLQVVRLSADARRAWSLQLSNGIELVLGRDAHYPRLMRFVRVYPQVLATRESDIRRIDLRYTNGFAVQWNGAAASGWATRESPEGGVVRV